MICINKTRNKSIKIQFYSEKKNPKDYLPDTDTNAIKLLPFLDNFKIASGLFLSSFVKSILGEGLRYSGNSSGSNGSSSSYRERIKCLPKICFQCIYMCARDNIKKYANKKKEFLNN